MKKYENIEEDKNIIESYHSNMNFTGLWDVKGANNFKNTEYFRCSFKGVKFQNIIFNNVIFKECSFKDCSFINCKIEYDSFMKFNCCLISKVEIAYCRFSNLYIKGCKVLNVKFKEAFMKGCNLIKNSYWEVKFINGCNLMNSIIDDTNSFMDIEFIDEKSYTKVNYGTYIGRFNYKNNSDFSNYINKYDSNEVNLRISNSYMAFADEFLKNKISGKYGICFYESKVAFHKTLKGRRKFISGAYDLLCGYGEKPSNTFVLTLILIIIFALIYMITGVRTVNNEFLSISILKESFSLYRFFQLFIYCLYFSIVTFATVGYGDIMAFNIGGMITVIIEIIIGVFMIGVWTSTLVRKMTR